MSNYETQPAIPFLSFDAPPLCVACGRLIQQGERAELLNGGTRMLPSVSVDGEGMVMEERPFQATFDLVHRECPA